QGKCGTGRGIAWIEPTHGRVAGEPARHPPARRSVSCDHPVLGGRRGCAGSRGSTVRGTSRMIAALSAGCWRSKARGPDGEGVFHEGRLTLGHRRLAILDLSEAGRQPMESADGRYVVAFNGEIYNFRELTRELDVPGQSLRSSSDTEVLLLAWERWGVTCLDRLVGQWAFALYDRREEVLWLVRDRFGEKPLFFHQTHGALTFASTLAGLVRAPWVSR